MVYRFYCLFYVLVLISLSVSLKRNYINFKDSPKIFKQSCYFIFSFSFWICLSYLVIIWHFLNISIFWIFIVPILLLLLALILDYVFGFKDVKSSPYILNFGTVDFWYLPGVTFVGYLVSKK